MTDTTETHEAIRKALENLAKRIEHADGEPIGIHPLGSNAIIAILADRDRLAAEVEAMRSVLTGLVQIWNKKAGGRAGSPNHGHNIPGIWDSDNGVLAGKPCAECAVYDMARAQIAAPPSPGQPS